MPRRPHNILSGARGRQMANALREDGRPSHFCIRLGSYGAGDFTIRRCANREGLSGGVVLRVRIGHCGDDLSPWGKSRSLRPGWTMPQLERALSTLFNDAMFEAHRRTHVEQLMALAKWVVPDHASHDEVTLYSNEADVPEAYDEMTLAHITIWRTWLQGRLDAGVAQASTNT